MTRRYAPASPDSPAGLLSTALGGGLLYSDTRSTQPRRSPPAAQQIAAIRQLRERLDEAEQQLAFHLRLAGATWADIAQLWDLNSPQRAQQKFGQSAGLLDKLEAATEQRSRP